MENIKSGIKPIAYKDHRTLSFNRTFGTAISAPISFDFDKLSSRPDQNADGLYQACTAYTNNDNASNEDGTLYDDYLFTYKNTLMMMNAPFGSPCDMMKALGSTTTYGVKSKSETPVDALKHRRAPYFIVQKVGDYFGGVLSALWINQAPLSIASPWYSSFEQVNADGTVHNPQTWNPDTERATWHNWAATGVVMVNGQQMIKCKSWQGPHYGVGGICYFSRDQINLLLGTKGAGCFGQKHATPEDIKRVEMSTWDTLLSYARLILAKITTPAQTQAIQASVVPVVESLVPEAPVGYLWDTPTAAKHSVRVICDESGLSVADKNDLCATVGAESGWNPKAVGKPNSNGTRDWGICQINDGLWIGTGKEFISTDYVCDHPEVCIRWMCKQWKAGHRNWWMGYKSGAYKAHL